MKSKIKEIMHERSGIAAARDKAISQLKNAVDQIENLQN